MIGKHLTLPTDELVLVSESGFTPDAAKKAAQFGIHTVSLVAALHEEWTIIVNKLTHIYLSLPVSTPIGGRVMYVRPYEASDLPSVGLDTIVYDSHGKELGTINTLAIKGLEDPENTKYVLTTYPEPGTYQYELAYSPSLGSYHVDEQGVVYEVSSLSFLIQVVVPDRIPLELNHRSFKNLQVAYGTFDQMGKDALLAIVEREGGSPSVAIRVPRSGSHRPS